MPGGGGPNGPCPAPGRGGDDQSGAELYPPGPAGYLCGGDIMDAFVKLVAAGPLFFVSAWLLMIFAGIVGDGAQADDHVGSPGEAAVSYTHLTLPTN